MNHKEIFGLHAVSSWLNNHPDKVVKLLLKAGSRSSRMDSLIKQAQEASCPIEEVSLQDLDRLVSGPHQGVVLKVRPVNDLSEKALHEFLVGLHKRADQPALVVILDGVTDPRNLGACLRSAAAARVDAIIVPKRNSADLSPVAMKAASGGSELVPLYRVTNLGRTIDKLKENDIWITGAVPDAESTLTEIDLVGHTALILGSEGCGIRRGILKRCDYFARIPMPETSLSLNVSVAAGIALYEVIRQRMLGFAKS